MSDQDSPENVKTLLYETLAANTEDMNEVSDKLRDAEQRCDILAFEIDDATAKLSEISMEDDAFRDAKRGLVVSARRFLATTEPTLKGLWKARAAAERFLDSLNESR